jgi:hypothetical protein
MSEFMYVNPDSKSGRAPEPDYQKKPLAFKSLTEEEWRYVERNATKLCPSRIARGLNGKVDPEWLEVKINELTGDKSVPPKRKIKV